MNLREERRRGLCEVTSAQNNAQEGKGTDQRMSDKAKMAGNKYSG